MRLLLDTNILSYAMRRQHGVHERIATHAIADIATSVIVLSEGLTGVEKSNRGNRWMRLWQGVVDTWPVLPFDAACAETYARIRADLERRGAMIGIHDCQIAATALTHGLIVVTDNDAEFKRVPGLKVENWVRRGTR
jgi:tRNA(fMet)-specific endonuclease VapC